MNISSCLNEDDMELDVVGKDKSEILQKLVAVFTNKTAVGIGIELHRQLLEREILKTTGIGSGIAIPHCRMAEVDQPRIILGLSRTGIDFQSLDNHPVPLIFLVFSPHCSGNSHLKICAKLVRLLKEEKIRQNLLSKQTKPEIVEYLNELEMG
jgi:fructose PTS system EIIBC or EIIC component